MEACRVRRVTPLQVDLESGPPTGNHEDGEAAVQVKRRSRSVPGAHVAVKVEPDLVQRRNKGDDKVDLSKVTASRTLP